MIGNEEFIKEEKEDTGGDRQENGGRSNQKDPLPPGQTGPRQRRGVC